MSVVASSDGGYDALLGSFITSVRADLDSPITSTFGSRIAEYRIEAQRIVAEVDGYSVDCERMRKLAKEVEETQANLAKQLLAFGQAAKEDEADLANLQMRNWQNNIVNPLLALVEAGRDIRSRGVERSCRDYENKFVKAEADAKKHAKVSTH
ncbi:unnamed protein product [Gongylonema pulchrum]|uniref:V-SNARE domain-containing protein n=1 Tax=Gongylonema pulchrum TaxID=637853 RepID=A0A183EI26_9BILA|nr:unnamed protein product [Gongylonema pulchrum]